MAAALRARPCAQRRAPASRRPAADSAAIVCSRSTAPVRSAAAMRSSARRYAVAQRGAAPSRAPTPANRSLVVPRPGQRPPLRPGWPPGGRRAPPTRPAPRSAARRRRVASAAHAGRRHRPAGRSGPWPRRRGASTSRCSWRSARSGSAARGQRGQQLAGAGVDRAACAVGVPQPEPPARAERGGGAAVSVKPYRASRPVRWAAGPSPQRRGQRPSSGQPAHVGRAGRASSPRASAANRSANGCHTSTMSSSAVGDAATRPRRGRARARPECRVGPRPSRRSSSASHSMWNCSPQAPVAEPERLVRVARRGGQQHRAERQLGDLVVVPLQHVGQHRQRPEQRIALGGVAPGHQAGPDLRPGRRCARRCRRAPWRAAGRRGRSRAWARGAGPPCAAAPPAPGTTARPGSPSGPG